MRLLDIYRRLNLKGVDALVLSACVQMPSLAAIPQVEAECGIPVVSAAIARPGRCCNHSDSTRLCQMPERFFRGNIRKVPLLRVLSSLSVTGPSAQALP